MKDVTVKSAYFRLPFHNNPLLCEGINTLMHFLSFPFLLLQFKALCHIISERERRFFCLIYTPTSVSGETALEPKF